jgi:hypothetical protein
MVSSPKPPAHDHERPQESDGQRRDTLRVAAGNLAQRGCDDE